uniref:Uncharacterized protein n=1 Tax=Cacopsylla melanoneura TaxID=428564 RepID=A0A8D8UYN5_9HEMI
MRCRMAFFGITTTDVARASVYLFHKHFFSDYFWRNSIIFLFRRRYIDRCLVGVDYSCAGFAVQTRVKNCLFAGRSGRIFTRATKGGIVRVPCFEQVVPNSTHLSFVIQTILFTFIQYSTVKATVTHSILIVQSFRVSIQIIYNDHIVLISSIAIP